MTTNLMIDEPAEVRRRPQAQAAPRLSAFGPTAQAPTAVFEATFRRRLAELADRTESTDSPPPRSTITLVVGALRDAASVDQVLDLARGVTAGDLSTAYHFVDRIRARADGALEQLLAEPTVSRFRQVDRVIERLVPRAAAELREVAATDPSRFEDHALAIADQIRRFDRRAVDIEARLSIGSPEVSRTELDDGCGGGIFYQPMYRPVRLGDLMPSRLANLLGERREDHSDGAGPVAERHLVGQR